MGILTTEKPVLRKRTNDAEAALELAIRLKQKKVYGVPVGTLRTTEFAALGPKDLPAKELLERSLDKLTDAEKVKIVRMAEIFNGAKDAKSKKGLFNMHALGIALYADEIWGHIQSQIDPDRARTGSFTITNPANDEFDHAHHRGIGRYDDVDAAVVVLDDRARPEEFLGLIAGNGSTAADFQHLGLSHHGFHYLVLEHELAHVSGAAEAQADMMAAAQYMKKFGTDDIPRAFADARVLDAIWITHSDMVHKSKARGSLLERFNPMSYLRRRKAAKTARTYNWSNVVAMDQIIDKGIAHSQSLTDEQIRDLRYVDIPFDKKRVEAMVYVLQDQCFRKGMKELTIRNMADVADEMIAGAELMPEMLDKTPGLREVMGLLKRFQKAANNLYIRAPGVDIEMLKKFKGKLPQPGPKPGAPKV